MDDDERKALNHLNDICLVFLSHQGECLDKHREYLFSRWEFLLRKHHPTNLCKFHRYVHRH